MDNYIREHEIIKIGKMDFTDIILDDPIEFVEYVSKTEYYISYVAWWEKVEIKNSEESIGGGGIRDKLDKNLFWAEVYYLGKKFNQDDKTGDIISYIENTQGLYPRHNLYPSFDLKIGLNIDKY